MAPSDEAPAERPVTSARSWLFRSGVLIVLVAFLLSALDLMLLVSIPVIVPALLFIAGVGLVIASRK